MLEDHIRPVAMEHLERLCEEHKACNIAASIKVSQARISLVRAGKEPMSDAFFDRLTAVYPLPLPKSPAVGGGSTKVKDYHDETVWLNTSKAQATDLTRQAEDSKGAIDEIDRLAVSGCYQTVRHSLLMTCSGACASILGVLMAPPETGPSVALREALGALGQMVKESEVRQAKIDPSVSSELYRQHSQFREAVRRKIDRLQADDEPAELAKLGAWRATLTSISAMLQPLPDVRIAAIAALTGTDELAATMRGSLEMVRSITFPCYQFQRDPVGFVRTILGEDPWEDPEGTDDDQVSLLESVRDHKRTVGPSARGVGKTKAVSWLSWWRYCCWDDGRVCLSNFTGAQLRSQDWAEILRSLSNSGICLDCRRSGVTVRPCPHSQCIDAESCETPTKGIWSENKERFIIGITGKEATALGGFHGIHIMVVCDEFSGLSYELFNAWKGNIAGPEARFFGPGNCLDTADNPMWDAVNDEKTQRLYQWHVVCLSGEVAARTKLPFLPDANELKADELSDERGRDNPLYMINNRGLYPKHDELCIYQAQHILRSQGVENYAATPAVGRLIVAIDPSGDSGEGDEFCIGVLRGLKLIEMRVGRGWGKEEYLKCVIELIERYREHRNETAIVGVDADGVGHKIVERLRDYLDTTRLAPHEKVSFDLEPVYFGQQARAKFDFEQVGDEAHFLVARWLARGGVVPYDEKLRKEMNFSKWFYIKRRVDDVWYDSIRSATRKDGPEGYRKVLHRSPDRLEMLRVFAWVAHTYNESPMQDARSNEEMQDAESQAPAVNPKDAFRKYIADARKGRYH